ncbi:MAG: tRNA epoxyqueuosine(34) reductase QueG [Planctomycetaceae bacterium]|nr:tRNA epoxyqueuosine(34) reductase QueG [Planctomycetaceae bacterium]
MRRDSAAIRREMRPWGGTIVATATFATCRPPAASAAAAYNGRMSPVELTAALKLHAQALGFGLAGVAPAVDARGAARLNEWLDRGYAGQMRYLSERREAYAHPRHVLEGVRSVVMLGLHYRTADPQPVAAGQGRVARYAWGSADYHDLIRERLHDLADYLRQLVPDAATRGVVDTAPLLEREFAQLAGLGWIGKNTLLLNRDAGSYFFLAALLTDVELAYDAPQESDHCGSCTACLDACPTNAFPQAGVLDASRCVSYLTIELRDHVPAGLRAGVGDLLFGCDVCQEVCPWNRFAPESAMAELQPLESMNPVELAALFSLSEADFRRRFRKTPLWRPHREGLLRNAAIVLGNQGEASGLSALAIGLNDGASLVRAAAAWALGRIAILHPEIGVAAILNERAEVESDTAVLAEIVAALATLDEAADSRRMNVPAAPS